MIRRFVAIVLSAGSGSRMNSSIPKQYMEILGKPMLYYPLKCFEECPYISEIIIVAAAKDINMVQTEIADAYGFKKVRKIVAGGKERYNSVFNGLKAAENAEYVMIHDGARPCIDNNLLDRLRDSVISSGACIPAVPCKDTVKIADSEGFVKMTPDRQTVWNVQTPQTFELQGIKKAYEAYMTAPSRGINITDDAMIWEIYDRRKVRIVTGDYKNIKLTTNEDIVQIENILKNSLTCNNS